MDKRRCPKCSSRETYQMEKTKGFERRNCEDCDAEFLVTFNQTDDNIKEITVVN